MKRLSESHNPYEAPNVEYVSDHRQTAASSETSSTWRIAAGLIPMPLALLLDSLYSPDASERFQLVFVFHFFLWPYSLVWAIVVAFINEYIVNPYIKFSAIAIAFGTLLIGFVAALTSGSLHSQTTTASAAPGICRYALQKGRLHAFRFCLFNFLPGYFNDLVIGTRDLPYHRD